MKTKNFILILILLTGFLSPNVHAGVFMVSVVINEGEKSDDSWSCERAMSIADNSLSYTKEYYGSLKGRKDDVSKTCTFSGSQVAEIQKLIKSKNLLVSDSLTDESVKNKNFKRYVHIGVVIIMEEKTVKINVNGDLSEIGSKDIYKNCYSLINLIEEYVEKC
jgi:hypothetical protein